MKNNQEILLDLADVALQEQLEDNLIVAISWAWYNGSYTRRFCHFLSFHDSRRFLLVRGCIIEEI